MDMREIEKIVAEKQSRTDRRRLVSETILRGDGFAFSTRYGQDQLTWQGKRVCVGDRVSVRIGQVECGGFVSGFGWGDEGPMVFLGREAGSREVWVPVGSVRVLTSASED